MMLPEDLAHITQRKCRCQPKHLKMVILSGPLRGNRNEITTNKGIFNYGNLIKPQLYRQIKLVLPHLLVFFRRKPS